jgi:hypothetical protein
MLACQIEGPTQSNPFGLKNIPVAASSDSTRERQNMNAFSLEIFGEHWLRLHFGYVETLHVQPPTVVTECLIRVWMKLLRPSGLSKAQTTGML